MDSQLAQLLFSFLKGLAIASVPGVVSYIVIRWLCERSPQHVFFAFTFIAVFIGFFGLIALADKLVFVVGSVGVWTLATFTDRAAQPSEESWFETFFKIAVSTVCSAISGLLLWFYLGGFLLQNATFSAEEHWVFNGFLTGGLVAPPALSIFFWIGKNIQLRPGVDRHLKEGEDAK